MRWVLKGEFGRLVYRLIGCSLVLVLIIRRSYRFYDFIGYGV